MTQHIVYWHLVVVVLTCVVIATQCTTTTTTTTTTILRHNNTLRAPIASFLPSPLYRMYWCSMLYSIHALPIAAEYTMLTL